MKTLSKEQVLRLHNALLETFGGTAGVRDDGLLESALNAPFATFGGQYLYPSVQAKAAQLGFGLVCNHPFVDGNKRIGAHVMLVFLAINGIELDYTQEELIDMRSQPLMAPTSTSRLKANSPTYVHTAVTTDAPVSTAGGLDEMAEKIMQDKAITTPCKQTPA